MITSALVKGGTTNVEEEDVDEAGED